MSTAEIRLEGDRIVGGHITLPPFQKRPRCAKCGTRLAWWKNWTRAVLYCPGGKDSREVKTSPFIPMLGVVKDNQCSSVLDEHLHFKCGGCGYEFFLACKDAK